MVQIGFYLWSLAALVMLLTVVKNGQSKTNVRWFGSLIILWICYLIFLEQSTILETFEMPPRVPILIVIPILVFLVLVSGRSSFQDILKSTPLHLPVYMQSFRIIVELLIYGAFLNGIFPERATFAGLNFDILVGISAPVVGTLVRRKIIGLNGLLGWNIISLLVLAVTVYSFISTYYFTDYIQTIGTVEFARFPYLLLASVLLPTAVFLHIISIRQIGLLRRSATLLNSTI